MIAGAGVDIRVAPCVLIKGEHLRVCQKEEMDFGTFPSGMASPGPFFDTITILLDEGVPALTTTIGVDGVLVLRVRILQLHHQIHPFDLLGNLPLIVFIFELDYFR